MRWKTETQARPGGATQWTVPAAWFLALLGALAGTPSLAQETKPYPARQITLVAPFPAGSATDTIARMLANSMSQEAKVPVVVENKPGADGNIAATQVARAAGDGYTVFITTNSTHAANASIFKALPFDPKADFLPVAGLVKIPIILAVKTDSPVESVADFIARARRAAKPLTFGSSSQTGRGAGEAMKVDLLNVPYKGSPQALTDLVGGQIDSVFGDPISAAGMVSKGLVRVLAVTSAARVATLPDVPTLAEAGLVDFELTAWVAMFVPAKTPRDAVERLNAYANAFLKSPTTVKHFAGMGSIAFPTTPEQLGSFAEAETKRWARIVEYAKIERQ
jgi:tripartite-type tricarboxylate transporter receptor subunit TctC